LFVNEIFPSARFIQNGDGGAGTPRAAVPWGKKKGDFYFYFESYFYFEA